MSVHFPRKKGYSKPMPHTAVSYFTKLGTYLNEEEKGRLRKISMDDESMMKLTVKKCLRVPISKSV